MIKIQYLTDEIVYRTHISVYHELRTPRWTFPLLTKVPSDQHQLLLYFPDVIDINTTYKFFKMAYHYQNLGREEEKRSTYKVLLRRYHVQSMLIT